MTKDKYTDRKNGYQWYKRIACWIKLIYKSCVTVHMLVCFSLFYRFCERWYYIGHFSLQFPLYLSLSVSNYLEHKYVPSCSPPNYSLMIQLNILEKIMDKEIHKIFFDSRKVRIKKQYFWRSETGFTFHRS